MNKKLSFKRFTLSRLLHLSMMIGLLICSSSLKSQNCSNTANIPINGQATINGVTVTTSYTGDAHSIFYSPTEFLCGNFFSGTMFSVGNTTAWSITFNFDAPVNDLVFIFGAANQGENFIFNSNGGPISIFANSNCLMGINGNQVYGATSAGGSGGFRIHGLVNYTTLTVNGVGGQLGTIMGVCSSSILSTKDSTYMENNTVNVYPTQVKDMMTISSKETLKSYKIFDESGKLILSAPLNINKKEINLSGIIPGNYIVSIETKTQTINKKIIKN
ncbi:T9SS type A sorting domain-containing protein [Chryseobacterium nematophagum]|nr:T9SS type A sorting domain-containing protein [Chryseobacterium nematophagum]